MLGKKRFTKAKKQNLNLNNNIKNKDKEKELEKDIKFKTKINKKIKDEKINIDSISENFLCENNVMQNESNYKCNFEIIKQKFKQIDNNYGENNISILNNIDRLIFNFINIKKKNITLFPIVMDSVCPWIFKIKSSA